MFDKTRLPYVALDMLCVLLASMPMAVLNLSQIYPFQRGFFCKDNSIQYPYHDSTVTSTVLTIVGLGLPISSILFIHERQRERGRDTGRGRRRLPTRSPMQDSSPGFRDQDLS